MKCIMQILECKLNLYIINFCYIFCLRCLSSIVLKLLLTKMSCSNATYCLCIVSDIWLIANKFWQYFQNDIQTMRSWKCCNRQILLLSDPLLLFFLDRMVCVKNEGERRRRSKNNILWWRGQHCTAVWVYRARQIKEMFLHKYTKTLPAFLRLHGI